ncbi:MAG: futalosine hydrolase [Planctomycetota bacterium]
MLSTLVLVPTDGERRVVTPAIAAATGGMARVELCGFGPVAAAARTAGLLAKHPPERVMLVGIAGRLDERFVVGAAYRFTEVACFGVGAGSGEAFETAGGMGWPHWPGDAADTSRAVGDVIALSPAPAPGVAPAGLLLTACAAAADPGDVALRRRLFPAAVAEDMEGFGVALACRLAGVPLEIVRGISNIAGDRDKARWQIGPALAAAAALAAEILPVISRETPR